MKRSCGFLVLAAVMQFCRREFKKTFELLWTGPKRVIFGKIPQELERFGMPNHPYQQMIPRHCWHPPPDIDIHKCCPKPNLYSNDLLDSCGVEKLPEKGSNVPAGPKKVPCQDGTCLMTKANLLLANGSIDYERLQIFIDQWAAANPDFTDSILAAKPLCAKPKGELWNIGHPPKICDPDRVFLCLQSQMFWNCKLKEFEECQRLREHMDECKPYYMKPKGYDEKIAYRNRIVQL